MWGYRAKNKELAKAGGTFSYSRDFPRRFLLFYRATFALRRLIRWLRIQKSVTKALGFQYRVAVDLIEIDLTYLCNLRCNNCNRSSAQAPEALHIDLDVIRQFVDESLEQRRIWARIRLLGGEAICGVKANTLITRALRRQSTRLNVVIGELAHQCTTLDIPAVDAGLTWGVATPPRNPGSVESALTLAVVADVLQRYCQGPQRDRLSSLMGMDSSTWEVWIEHWRRYLLERVAKQHPRSPCDPGASVPDLLNQLKAKLDGVFSNRTQIFTAFLNREVNPRTLSSAIEGMETCSRGAYLSMENPTAARQLLQFIREMGMNPRCARLVCQHSSEGANQHRNAPLTANISRSFGLDLLQRQHPRLASVFQQELGIQPVVRRRPLWSKVVGRDVRPERPLPA